MFRYDLQRLRRRVEDKVAALKLAGARERDLYDFSDMRNALWQTLHIPEVWKRPNQEELGKVEEYVTLVELLLDCRDSSLSIGRETWENICGTLVAAGG